MRRMLVLFLALYTFVLPAAAAQQKQYAALVIDSSCSGKYTNQLLEGLYDRGLRATFLLKGCQLSDQPDILDKINTEGHEIGCRGFSGGNMVFMSRRQIAAEIMEFEAMLPNHYPLRLFCPPGGCSDGVRQVAEARRLAILSWSADVSTPAQEIRDGDLVLLRDNTRLAVESALSLADQLMENNFDLVTVSQLAKLRQTPIRPGQVYSSFPKAEGGEA